MLDDIFEELTVGFADAKAALQRELGRLRTGRASASLLDEVRVDYYGQQTPVTQVATVKVPEPRMISITPWDKNMLSAIERALHMANLDLNPTNDGSLIRLVFPPLTGEVRDRLAKSAKRHGEDAKVRLRTARRDANDMLKALEKDGDLSEDELHRELAKVQEAIDSASKAVDVLVDAKEAEIREV